MIENDSDDRYLTEERFSAEGLEADIDFVYSADAQAYIREAASSPHLILLDRNTQPFPFTDLIRHIRQTEGYEAVPVIVLSTTSRPEDVRQAYACGANSYIRKPDDYAGTLFKVKSFIHYWFQSVELPPAQTRHSII